MIRYCDTSFLAPLLRGEASSQLIRPFLNAVPTGELALSHWTKLEMSSALARDVRMGILSAVQATHLETSFAALVTNVFTVITPEVVDFERAQRYIRRYETQLRAGDALHLAIAHNRNADEIYSLDKGLLAAGKLLGLPVSTGIALPGY